MKSYFYLIISESDDLERKTIYNVSVGASAQEQAKLQKLQFIAANRTKFYFQKRSLQSSDFVRNLMDEFSCILKNINVSNALNFVVNCLPQHVLNLSVNYQPLSTTRQ